jgi:hypothetical protein
VAYYWKALSLLPLTQAARAQLDAEIAASRMAGENARSVWVSYACASCSHPMRSEVRLCLYNSYDPRACTHCQICRLLEGARYTDERARAMRARAGRMLESRHRGDARAAAAAEKRAAKEAKRQKKGSAA